MPTAGRKRKKKRSEKPEAEVSETLRRQTPRCFVLKRGKVGNRVRDLVKDFRQVMMPNCAKALRESKANRIEDFIAVAGQFHVTHFILFSGTKFGTYMKLIKLPAGPTLTFKVSSFSLMRDVRTSQRKPRHGERDFTSAPLQVLNGFAGGSAEKQLTTEMLRGLFPPIDVPSFNQAECRRTALFHHDREQDVIHFRHFSVGRKVAGLQRGVSKLLRKARIPTLGNSMDVADFVLSGGVGASESENEADMEAPVAGGGKVGIRLTEVGPRVELSLIKSEEGVCNGAVLYHRYHTKLPSQAKVLEEKARQRKKLKERNAGLSSGVDKRTMKKMKDKKDRRDARREEGREEQKEEDKQFGAAGSDSDGGGKDASGKKAGSGGKGKKRFHPLYGKKKKSSGSAEAQSGKGSGKGRSAPKDQVLNKFHKAMGRQ